MKSIRFIAAAMPRSVTVANLLVYGKWLLIATLIIVLAHTMARLFWLLIPEPTLVPITEPSHQQDAVSTSDSRKSVDIQALKALALFDDPPKVAEQPVDATLVPTKEAAETVLNVKLNGVFVSSDSTQAHAIIAQGKKQSLYRVNEELANLPGVKLVDVLVDRVIIDNNGKHEAILLYPDDEQKPKGERISAADTNHHQDALAREPNPHETDYTAEQIHKKQQLADIVKVSMERENGAVVGFRVMPGRNRQVFDDLGLQTNDIVTAVNGIELTSSQVAMEAYRLMRNTTQASVQVKRGDERLTFDIDISALEQ
jgi:general secretion pathway protein C